MRVHLAPWTRLPSRQDCYAVASPYRPAFIEALKAKVPWGCCHWESNLQIWTVEASHLTELVSLLLEHFPKEERCPLCFESRPCPVWTEKDRLAREHKRGGIRSLYYNPASSRVSRRKPRRS
jgi:hypothetical protein